MRDVKCEPANDQASAARGYPKLKTHRRPAAGPLQAIVRPVLGRRRRELWSEVYGGSTSCVFKRLGPNLM